jgi:site-specific DNA-methyltransferase (adenine-specific)
MRASINLYNGDCMEAMAKMKDKQFDLAIVDPPYGKLSSFNNRRGLNSFENIEPPKEYYNHLLRVSKNQIVWGINYLENCLFKGGGIVWNKLGTITNHRKQAPTIGDAELAYQSITNNVKIFSYGWMGNVTGNGYAINSKESRERFHPTQKPVALYKWLLKNYAKEGDTILDTHLGSGSIAIACHDMGFDLEAYELDSDYYRDCMKRFKNHTAQTQLF